MTKDLIEVLRGTRKGRHLALETKIERFPAMIRADKKSTLILSDPNQIKEPFKSFVEDLKEIRNSSVHHTPEKASIWRPPQEWLDKAYSASKICLEVSEKFWQACYPSRSSPVYLDGLNYNRYLHREISRLEQEREIE